MLEYHGRPIKGKTQEWDVFLGKNMPLSPPLRVDLSQTVAQPLTPALRRQVDLCEFKGRLVCRMSSWIARVTHRETVSQKTKTQQQQKGVDLIG